MPKYEAGDVLRGYRLLEPFRRANGGNCEWTFAERGGDVFFIKNFFQPKYPVSRNGQPPRGDVTGRIARCQEFEAHQKKLMDAAKVVGGRGGRLVIPVDFFREEAIYYKVAYKVEAAGLEAEEISRLPFPQKQSIMSAVISALQALHNARIVHGDLSTGNILITYRGDTPSANVIDFDSSFLDGDPPPKEDTMGNPPYYSPELLTYLQEDDGDGSKLTTKSDIFALGVVFWEYLYGQKPKVAEPFHYACEAVRAGKTLAEPAGDVPPGARDLLHAMLSNDPADRPSMRAIQTAIKAGFPHKASEEAKAEAERAKAEAERAEKARADKERREAEDRRKAEEAERALRDADPSNPRKRIKSRLFDAKDDASAPAGPDSRPAEPASDRVGAGSETPPADPTASRIRFRKRGD